MKKVMLLMSLALAMTNLTACKDNGGNEEKKDPKKDETKVYKAGDKCTADQEDSLICGDGEILLCSEGSWELFNKCASGTVCATAKADPETPYCTKTCTGNETYSVCKDVENTPEEELYSDMNLLYILLVGYEGYSMPYTCQDGSDGKKYLLPDSEAMDVCDHGCNEDADACLKLVEDEGAECSSSFVERCDGTDKNIVVFCGQGTVYAIECSGACSIKDSDKTADCTIPCQETEAGEISKCSVGEDYFGYEISETNFYTCEKTTDNKWAAFPDYERDSEECLHECNADKSGCLKLAEDEGASCTFDFKERCDGDIVVYCDVDEESGLSSITAFKCDTGYNCKVKKDANYADCAKSCTEADANKITASCDTRYKKDYGIEIISSYKCQETTDGSYAAFISGKDYCESCGDGTCKNEKKGLEAKVGDECDYYLFQDRCSTDGKVFTCNCNQQTGACTVATSACEEGSCATMTSEDYNGQIACIDKDASTSCQSGAADTFTCKDVQSTDGKTTYHLSVDNICIDFKDIGSLSLIGNYMVCEDGCNNATGLCNILK